MLSLAEWAKFIDLFHAIVANKRLTAKLYKMNLQVPPVIERFKIIKEFQKAIGGHRGMSKIYSKIANYFYLVKQFVCYLW